MTTQVTQCPKCSTSFRITPAQLAIANGAVRCGSCLHIFNASDYWLSSPTDTAHSEQQNTPPDLSGGTEPTPAANSAEENALDDIFDGDIFADDADLDELANDLISSAQQSDDPLLGELLSNHGYRLHEEDNEQLSSEALELDSQTSYGLNADEHGDTIESNAVDVRDIMTEENSSAPLIDDANTIYAKQDSASDGYPSDDDSEDSSNNSSEDTIHSDMEFSPSFQNITAPEDTHNTVFTDLNDIEQLGEESEHEWTQKLLEEDETNTHTDDSNLEALTEPDADDDEFNPDPFSDLLNINSESTTNNEETLYQSLDHESTKNAAVETGEASDVDLDSDLDENKDIAAHSTEPLAPQEPVQFAQEPIMAGERIGSHNHALLASLEPDPVEMPRLNQRKKWQQRGWVASIMLAACLLAAQYIAFNADRLSRDPSYRPTLTQLCTVIGCQLPNLDNVKLIRSSNLVIRSHPSIKEALVIDAIITNRASFIQPYPIMELQFTDLSGQVIADRRFYPKEYLAGELTGKKMMPTKQPIHISLEIVDPGQQAVNYQLQFHPLRDS